jgi:hypothetical protein
LEALAMDVHQIKGDVSALKKDVAILKEGQQRHEKILETLALRSIEHETQIRDFHKPK